MGNQHPSTFEERLRFLAMNAKFGDGYFWRHPECRNSKIIFESTSYELLEAKRRLCPEIFRTGVKQIRKKCQNGRFDNAKPLYKLASLTHPIFTEYHKVERHKLVKHLTLNHLGLWYLDDGGFVERREYKDRVYHRFYICIGTIANTPKRKETFESHMRKLFPNVKTIGKVQKNNSKASENNKTWFIPKDVANTIMSEARKYKALLYKFPHGEGSTTIPSGSRETGLSLSKRTPRKKRIVRRHKKAS